MVVIKYLVLFIQKYWRPLTIIFFIAILALSLWPLEHFPAVPGGDKLHHLIAYAALVFPVALRKPQHWLLLVLFFIACSGGIELVQPLVNRYGEWLDMAANTAGVGGGILVAQIVRQWVQEEPGKI